MSQIYTITDVRKGKIVKDSYGEFQNYALALKEFGEPVKLTRAIGKEEPKIGDAIYGDIEQFEADGRFYNMFKMKAKPEPQPMTKDETIKAEWAIGQAIQVWIGQGCLPEAYDNIESEAKHFYEMINNIRGDL